jgi:ribosomal protein S18 acetylase RimI-like enzyme
VWMFNDKAIHLYKEIGFKERSLNLIKSIK